MVNYNYKRRTQPEFRSHLGELPTKENTKHRFTKIKEQQKQLKDIITNVEEQTGDEFFFNMQNCYKKDNNVYKKTIIDEERIKKQIILCDFEIRKARKRITVENKKVEHLRFESESDSKENEYKFTENKNDKKYLNELIMHRGQLQAIIENSERVNKAKK